MNKFLSTTGVLLSGLLCAQPVFSQEFRLPQINVQKHANGILSLMSYSVVPDLTTSSLSINNANSENPSITMAQLGGGATMSESFPIYLEGSIAYSRYDPTFVATNGTESRVLPLKWNSVAATGGVGWDFPIALNGELKLRPIVNISLGQVSSDLAIGQWLVNEKTDLDLSFLDRGTLKAYGYGGSLMLDYEHYRENYEVDVELRYTNIRLESFGSTSTGVKGHADAETANIWARYRAPTGGKLLKRPLRYVLETSHSSFLGSQRGILGFNDLTTLGVGLELDSSAYPVFITRTRLLVRHVFGHNVSGWSMGLAVSF